MQPFGPGARPVLPRHLYVHVPLCHAKCAYCDFYSLTPGALGLTAVEVVSRLVDQARAWTERDAESMPLETLYVGGGTPSALGGALPTLVREVLGLFGRVPGAEVTIEANPESFSVALARALAEAGVTRVSLGVQSLDDAELHALGRIHSADEALAAAAAVADAGLELALDLMCGLPGQSGASWEATLASALGTGAAHVSVYPLSVETGTPLASQVDAGAVALPDADATADMMLAAAELLAAAGLCRYEVANYARPGHESRHNTAYWTGREYLGAGPSAHGMLARATAAAVGINVADGAARIRYAVPDMTEGGLEARPALEIEVLDAGEAAREDAMLGLRRTEGISDALATRAGVRGALESLSVDGLIEHAGGRWRTTERGWLLGNEVFGRVWNAP
jgi:oxygen-independent coproporphyrinogen-3 oxidase